MWHWWGYCYKWELPISQAAPACPSEWQYEYCCRCPNWHRKWAHPAMPVPEQKQRSKPEQPEPEEVKPEQLQLF